MNASDKKYAIQITAFTLVLLLISTFLFYFFPILINSYIWGLILYIGVLTYLVHFVIKKGFSGDAYDMQNYFMAGTFIKLILCMLILGLYVYFVREDKVRFTLNFFTVYFMYTFFEIKTLLLSLQPQNRTTKEK